MKFKHIYQIIIPLFLSIYASGCGIYTFSGNVPGHLKSVAIPTFENKTAEFGLVEDLTDSVVDRFTLDNSLKIKQISNADCVLYCTLNRIEDMPSTFTADGTVQEKKITLYVKVIFHDLVKDKVIFEEQITGFGIYSFASGVDERDSGIELAVERIAEEILNKTVSGW